MKFKRTIASASLILSSYFPAFAATSPTFVDVKSKTATDSLEKMSQGELKNIHADIQLMKVIKETPSGELILQLKNANDFLKQPPQIEDSHKNATRDFMACIKPIIESELQERRKKGTLKESIGQCNTADLTKQLEIISQFLKQDGLDLNIRKIAQKIKLYTEKELDVRQNEGPSKDLKSKENPHPQNPTQIKPQHDEKSSSPHLKIPRKPPKTV